MTDRAVLLGGPQEGEEAEEVHLVRSAGKQRKHGNATLASRSPLRSARCHMITDDEDEWPGGEQAHGAISAEAQFCKRLETVGLQDQGGGLHAHHHVQREEEIEPVRTCASNPRKAGYRSRSRMMMDEEREFLEDEQGHGAIATQIQLWKTVDTVVDRLKSLEDQVRVSHAHQHRQLDKMHEPDNPRSLNFTLNPQAKGYSAIYWNCQGNYYKRREVATDEAMKVKVRFNVIQVIQLDQRAESFQAYFTMHLYWTDPLLQRRKMHIIYKAVDKDGNYMGNCERDVFLVGAPGYNTKDQYEFIFPVTQEDEKGLARLSPEEASQWQWLNSGFENTGCSRLEVPAGRLLFQGQPDWDNEHIFRLKWSFQNLLGEMFVPYQHQKFLYLTEHGGCVHQKFTIIGQFSESLELQRLPFDRQLLRLKFVCEKPMEEVQLSLLPARDDKGKGAAAGTLRVSKDGRGGIAENVVQPKSRIEKGPWMTPREWDVFAPCRTYCLADSLSTKKDSGIDELNFTTLQRLDVVIHFQRDPRFYLFNVVLFMFVLTLATGISFLVDVQDVATRTSILLTLLLCTVGYKNIVSDQLPQKPYWTRLDWYILAAFLVQISCLLEVACVLNFACSPVDDTDRNDNIHDNFDLRTAAFKYRAPPSFECFEWAHEVDKGFAGGVFAIWVLSHVMFVFAYCCCDRSWFFPSSDALYKKDAPEYSDKGVGSPHLFGLAVKEHD